MESFKNYNTHFIKEHKYLSIILYMLGIAVIVTCIIALVFHQKIHGIEQNGQGLWIYYVVWSSLTFVCLLISLYTLTLIDVHWRFYILALFLFLFFSFVQAFSMFMFKYSKNYCGYYISNNQNISGYDIIDELKLNIFVPYLTCEQMDQSQNLRDQIINNCIQAIKNMCKRYDQRCYNFDSLYVEEFSQVISPYLTALVFYIVASGLQIIFMIITVCIRKSKQQSKKDLLLLNEEIHFRGIHEQVEVITENEVYTIDRYMVEVEKKEQVYLIPQKNIQYYED